MAAIPRPSRSFVRSVVIATVGLVIGRGVGLARSFAFVGLLPPEELGRWGIAYGTLPLLAWLLTLGLPAVLARYSGQLDRMAQRRLLGLSFSTVGLSGAVLSLAALALSGPVAYAVFGSSQYTTDIHLLCLAAAFMALLHLCHGTLQGQRRFLLDTGLQVVYSVLFAATALVSLTVLRPTTTVALGSYAAATLFVLLVAIAGLRRLPPALGSSPLTTPPSAAALLWFGTGICVGGIVEDIWPMVDRYAVLHVLETPLQVRQYALGQYQIALTLASPLVLVLSAVGVVVLPYAARLFDASCAQDADRHVSSTVRFAAVAFLPCGFALLWLGPPLLRTIVGVPDGLWRHVLPFCLATGGLIGLQHVYKASFVCRGQSWRLVAVWTGMCVANVVLSVLLVRSAGLAGAAAASVVTGLGGSVLMSWMLHRVWSASWRRDAVALMLPAFCLGSAGAGLAVAAIVVWLCAATGFVLDETDRELLRAAWCKLQLGGRSSETATAPGQPAEPLRHVEHV